MPPVLVVLTGPIAAGKNTVATHLANRCAAAGRHVVVVDLDDIVFAARSTEAWDPWPAARRVQAKAVAEWFAHGADVVIAVGPFHLPADDTALVGALPERVVVTRVLLDAPLEVTWARAQNDPVRALSRDRTFHETAYARYEELRSGIAADLVLDSSTQPADALAQRVYEHAVHLRTDVPAPAERRREQMRQESLAAASDPADVAEARRVLNDMDDLGAW